MQPVAVWHFDDDIGVILGNFPDDVDFCLGRFGLGAHLEFIGNGHQGGQNRTFPMFGRYAQGFASRFQASNTCIAAAFAYSRPKTAGAA